LVRVLASSAPPVFSLSDTSGDSGAIWKGELVGLVGLAGRTRQIDFGDKKEAGEATEARVAREARTAREADRRTCMEGTCNFFPCGVELPPKLLLFTW
jgi:hypothetical protein